MDALKSRRRMYGSAKSRFHVVLCATLVFTQVAPLWAGPPLFKRVFAPHQDWGKKPKMNEDYCLELTAKNIDWLEHQIDHYGSIVPKVPDVWGEARLTKYRREVEEELSDEVGKFDEDRISGTQYVSDSFLFAAALSLQADGSGTAPPVTIQSASAAGEPASESAEEGGITITQNGAATPRAFFGDESFKFGEGGIQLEQTAVLDQHKRYLNHLNELRRINEGDDTADAPGYAMSLVRVPVSVIPGTVTKQGWGAEITMTATPEIDDELLPRTFKDLVINDLVDQLALPIVRLMNNRPNEIRNAIKAIDELEQVSSDAQKQVDELGPVLLRAIGDAIDQDPEYTPLDASFIEERGQQEYVFISPKLFGISLDELKAFNKSLEDLVAELLAKNPEASSVARKGEEAIRRIELAAERPPTGILDESEFENYSTQVLGVPTQRLETTVRGKLGKKRDIALELIDRAYFGGSTIENGSDSNPPPPEEPASDGSLSVPSAPLLATTLGWNTTVVAGRAKLAATASAARVSGLSSIASSTLARLTQYQKDRQIISTFYDRFAVPARTSRRSVLPFPASQLLENYGQDGFERLIVQVYRTLSVDPVNREVFHLPDIQGILRDELYSAYRLLELDANAHIWQSAAVEAREIVREIRQRKLVDLEVRRTSFLNSFRSSTDQLSIALSWMVFVESMLLNEQFNEEARQYLGANCVGWMPYFGPNPPLEVRDQFLNYVMVRWPLKIFTVDPVNTEQNIADVSVIYREMQLAVALSVAAGNMRVGAAMRALRQIQRETATIDRHRMTVGFSHGDDTFGWRFYPRFQTPPVESNLTAFFRDTLVGGPTDKALEKKKELEPGMRECIALVIMPSFIKGVSVETRSNWFRLDKPGRTAMSMQDTMEFSRAVEQMRRNVEKCVCNQHLYRPGEVTRVLNRVRQLDRELPLQSLSCQVPIENALGGFELLSSGTRELAPELLGWYGAPGYDYTSGGTFFLVGNNFSVHETRVIAGGKEISQYNPLRGTDCESCSDAIKTAIDGASCPAGEGGTPAAQNAKDRCNAADLLLNRPSVVLLSRDVMQVTLPKGLPIVRDRRLQSMPPNTLVDGEDEQYHGYVDVHVATPYGVSGHMLIPVLCAEDPCEAKPEPAKPAETTPKKEVKVTGATLSSTGTVTVIAEAASEIGRSEPVLRQLWCDVVRGLGTVELLPNNTSADTIDVRVAFSKDNVVVGEHVFEGLAVRKEKIDDKQSARIQLGVAEQLSLLASDGLLFQATAASRNLLHSKTGQELGLDASLYINGAAVDGGPVLVKGKKLEFRIVTPRKRACDPDSACPSPGVEGRISIELEGNVSSNVENASESRTSLWQPIGPVKPASWESTASEQQLNSEQRLKPVEQMSNDVPAAASPAQRPSTQPQSTQSRAIQPRAWSNPAGKRSSVY